MFLLRPDWSHTKTKSLIHLHSNMFLLRLLLHHLWRSFVTWFTFQYVSIKTCLAATALVLHDKLFTFQYVSIKTLRSGRNISYVANLHSNMFLLRQPDETRERIVQLLFTFQYVSIKTFFAVSVSPWISYLHSNMFLLRRLQNVTVFIFCLNLHSNMFLLRRYCYHKPTINPINLHSNMFLLRLVSR